MVSKSWITLSRITIFQKAVCLPACHKVFVTNKCSSLLPFQAVTFWATLFSDDDKNMASLSLKAHLIWESEGKEYIYSKKWIQEGKTKSTYLPTYFLYIVLKFWWETLIYVYEAFFVMKKEKKSFYQYFVNYEKMYFSFFFGIFLGLKIFL